MGGRIEIWTELFAMCCWQRSEQINKKPDSFDRFLWNAGMFTWTRKIMENKLDQVFLIFLVA